MSNVDLKKIHDELTEAFINYQYRIENPMMKPTDKEDAEFMYRADHVFNSKVKSLTSGVMSIVSKNI